MKLDVSKFISVNLRVICSPQSRIEDMKVRYLVTQFVLETIFGVDYDWREPIGYGILDTSPQRFLFSKGQFPDEVLNFMSDETLDLLLDLDEDYNLARLLRIQRALGGEDESIFLNPACAPEIRIERAGKSGMFGKLYVMEGKQRRFHKKPILWTIRNTNLPTLLEEWNSIELPSRKPVFVSV